MKKILLLFLFCCHITLVWAKTDYSKIDQAAFEAPVLKNSKQLSSFVHRLVRPYSKDDEKARVLLAWIVHNIDYDKYKSNAIEDTLDRTKKKDKELYIPTNDILETRMGVCEDIAKLYKQMCEAAGLSAVTISGKTRGEKTTLATFEDGESHMWNAVRINREWEYVDPTWAIGGENTESLGNVSKKKDYDKIVRQRESFRSDAKTPRKGRAVKDEWFMTDKDEMIKTHFPTDERWQLQDKKITKEEFLGLTNKKDYRAARKELREKRRENIR